MEDHAFKRRKLNVDRCWPVKTAHKAAALTRPPIEAPHTLPPFSLANSTPPSNSPSTQACTTIVHESTLAQPSSISPKPLLSPSRLQPIYLEPLHDGCSNTDPGENGGQTAFPSPTKEGFFEVCFGMVSAALGSRKSKLQAKMRTISSLCQV